jgi:2-polyprenyl-3-methyl-5-hydroxy-6-metoxy-1,4-benzoquinol methylase
MHNIWLGRQYTQPLNQECPVCLNYDTYLVHIHYSGEDIPKKLCRACRHLYSNNLRQDIERAGKFFNYQNENLQKPGQQFLLEKLFKNLEMHRPGENFSVLDFGAGGNLSSSAAMREKHPGHRFFACDLIPRKDDFYFQTYQDDSKLSFFDGISSNAVIEHLDNTLEAWLYLNRLLKPVGVAPTWMLHAFPSQINEDPWHWALRIRSHECLFSETSLKMVCDKAGFECLETRDYWQVQHPVFLFRKVADR